MTSPWATTPTTETSNDPHPTPPPPDQVQEFLARQSAELAPGADRLRTAMLRGESPGSLGLVEEGLTAVLQQRGISAESHATSPAAVRKVSEADPGASRELRTRSDATE